MARGRYAPLRDVSRSRRRQPGAEARQPRRPVSGERPRGGDSSMTRLHVTPLYVTLFLLTPWLSCSGDRSRSPTCGMAQLIGPSLIQDRLRQLPFVLTDAPRGLPGTLPVRVIGTPEQSTVLAGYIKGALPMA